VPRTVSSLRALIIRLPADPDVDDTGAHLSRLVTTALVGIGGMFGTLARASVAEGIPVTGRGWPTATLTVNLVGALLLGVLLTVVQERYPYNPWARPLLGAGFCGGFTTFSAFAVEFTARAESGRVVLAAGYVVVSVGGSVLAALVGVMTARATARLANQKSWRRRLHRAARAGDEESA
jgi:CrcB protein